jgi:two-component system cell cycle sensor histidine kinase/response regulator CckA
MDNLNGKNTILIVDDEPVVLKVATMMIKKLNYGALQAKNAMEASHVFSDNKDIICLVILDMQLPDGNGSDICKKLKAIKSDVKILHIGGFGRDQGIDSLDCGCHEFLSKPFRIEELSNKIEELLENTK